MKTSQTAKLAGIVKFMDAYCRADKFDDYPAAHNGLEFENSGEVRKIAAAVDAGVAEIRAAAEIGADLLVVHHGMFWRPPIPAVGANYEKIRALVKSDIAVYAMHLPLDAHEKIGNNVLICRALNLRKIGRCFECGGAKIGVLAAAPAGGRAELERRLKKLFPKTYKEIPFGTKKPKRVAVCSGSCGDAVAEMPKLGIDTLVCGELREHHFAMAQELGLNLYPCGHCATERFGAEALGKLAAEKFSLGFEFIESENPL